VREKMCLGVSLGWGKHWKQNLLKYGDDGEKATSRRREEARNIGSYGSEGLISAVPGVGTGG